MTSFCIQLIVSQIATESLSALVKETELLRIRQTVKANLPSQDHFDHLNALRSRAVHPQQKGSGRGAFPKHDRGGFLDEMFFCKCFIFLSTDLWHRANPHLFVRQLRPELIRYLPAFCILYSYLCYFII